MIACTPSVQIADSCQVVSRGRAPAQGFLRGWTGGAVCTARCYSRVPSEAQPDAGMAENCGFSADVERVKGIEPSS